jgi:hypothetical protein
VKTASLSVETHGRAARDSAASGDPDRDRSTEVAESRRARPWPSPPEAPRGAVAPQRTRYGHPHPEIFLG